MLTLIIFKVSDFVLYVWALVEMNDDTGVNDLFGFTFAQNFL